MAGGRKLKVFRTVAGFHDAYVAAPSRKAALAAWGVEVDLFARGQAEEVTDPALTAEPLSRPGEVVKRSRGSAAEQIAALPPDRPKRRAPELAEAAERPRMASAPPAKPIPKLKPSRAVLDAAEQAVEAVARRHAEAREALAREEQALAERRRTLERDQSGELARAERARDEAGTDYRRKLAEWRG